MSSKPSKNPSEQPGKYEQDFSTPSEPTQVRGCPECGAGPEKIYRPPDTGETVCRGCGFVISSKTLDQGPERPAYDGEQIRQRRRHGNPLTYSIHDQGLSTQIDWRDKDACGKKFSPAQKAQYYRLRKWQRRIRVSNATERNLAFALSDITRIGHNLTVPKNVIETASVDYRKAVKEHLVRGRSIAAMTAAATYVACRECGIARTLEDVSQASGVNKKEIGRCYRFILKELDIFVPPQKPGQYVTKFSNQLTTQGKTEEIAQKTLKAAKEVRLLSGRGPTGVAAAASYIASVLSGERKTQREIAEMAQVTEVTIRNRYKELLERLLFEIAL